MTLLLPLLAFVVRRRCSSTRRAWRWRRAGAAAIERRLGEIAAARATAVRARRRCETIVGDVQAPRAAWRRSRRRRWASCSGGSCAAGFRSNEALVVFFGIRVGCALAVVRAARDAAVRPAQHAAGARRLRRSAICCRAWCSARLAKRRQHRIRLSLPDALDLLVVSVEAGSASIRRFSASATSSRSRIPICRDELRLVNLELRAGKARSEALHNLADRTGVDDCRRSWRCSCRPTSSARAWRSRCASTPTRCGPSGGSGRRKRRPRPA